MSFPRYPRYRPSGVEWLGPVPEHWEIHPIKRTFRIVGGGTPASDNEAYWMGDIAWATPGDLGKSAGLHILETQRSITADGLASCNATLVPPGSLILSTRAPIGSLGVADVPLCTNQGCKSLVPLGATQTEFYAHMLTVCTEALRVRGKGTTFLELSADDLGAFKLPTPPPSEQGAIAAFLDRETAKIDVLVAEQERLIDLLKEKRQAVISHAVTRGLEPSTPTKPSGIEWLGAIPAHWGTIQSRRIFVPRSEPALPDDVQLTVSQKYGVLPQSEFIEREGRRLVEVIMGMDKLKHVEPDDFIISMRSFEGGIEWCRRRGATSFHYVMLKPIKDVYPPYFARLFKCTPYIQALQTTTDLIRDGQELRYSNFVLVDLPLVPETEQRAIAAFLDKAIPAIDDLAAEAARAVALLLERRSALISAAVTGQIDVRDAVAVEVA